MLPIWQHWIQWKSYGVLYVICSDHALTWFISLPLLLLKVQNWSFEICSRNECLVNQTVHVSCKLTFNAEFLSCIYDWVAFWWGPSSPLHPLLTSQRPLVASFFQVFHGLRGDFSDRAAETESHPHQAVFALELAVWGKPWHFGNGAKIKCHEKWGGLQIPNSLLETNLHPPADVQFVDCSSERMEKTHRWMTKGQKGDSGAEHGSVIRSNTRYTRVVSFLCGLVQMKPPSNPFILHYIW